MQPFRKFGVPPESLLTLTPLHPPQSLSGPTSRERLTGEGRGKKKFGKSGGERRAARERHRERNEVNALFKRATGSRRGMSVYTRSPSVTHPSTDISRTETRSYRRRSSTPGGEENSLDERNSVKLRRNNFSHPRPSSSAPLILTRRGVKFVTKLGGGMGNSMTGGGNAVTREASL